MKLGKRNLVYSLLLAFVMLSFLVGYFVYMLPSLYVDYTMEQNLKAVKEQHRAYAENGSYADVSVRNPTACFSVRIPDEGDSLFFAAKMFSVELKIEDERLRGIYGQMRSLIKSYGQSAEDVQMEHFGEELQGHMDAWAETLSDVFSQQEPLPFELKLLEHRDMQGEWFGEYEKVHAVSDELVVFEMGVEDANAKYINYIAVERMDAGMLFTFLPVLMPDMNEIRPVVLQSLPMLFSVILLLVLLFSQVYSRGIVTPIVRLVRHTEQMKSSPGLLLSHYPPVPGPRGKRRVDEIGMLSATIDELYGKIRESYEELAENNEALAEENRRQEVLLRACSHQLKTPVSAALLLVDGMKNKIGRYQDTEKYLPKVKEQLLSMKKIVEDILYLNHCKDRLDMQELAPGALVERQLAACRIAAAEKKLSIEVREEGNVRIESDETIFSYILANLLSNAVNYTPAGGKIDIVTEARGLTIRNYGAHIDEALLPHIFEPFVTCHDRRSGSENGHGLGLYIAAYYAKQVGMRIQIENEEACVAATLCFQA